MERSDSGYLKSKIPKHFSQRIWRGLERFFSQGFVSKRILSFNLRMGDVFGANPGVCFLIFWVSIFVTKRYVHSFFGFSFLRKGPNSPTLLYCSLFHHPIVVLNGAITPIKGFING